MKFKINQNKKYNKVNNTGLYEGIKPVTDQQYIRKQYRTRQLRYQLLAAFAFIVIVVLVGVLVPFKLRKQFIRLKVYCNPIQRNWMQEMIQEFNNLGAGNDLVNFTRVRGKKIQIEARYGPSYFKNISESQEGGINVYFPSVDYYKNDLYNNQESYNVSPILQWEVMGRTVDLSNQITSGSVYGLILWRPFFRVLSRLGYITPEGYMKIDTLSEIIAQPGFWNTSQFANYSPGWQVNSPNFLLGMTYPQVSATGLETYTLLDDYAKEIIRGQGGEQTLANQLEEIARIVANVSVSSFRDDVIHQALNNNSQVHGACQNYLHGVLGWESQVFDLNNNTRFQSIQGCRTNNSNFFSSVDSEDLNFSALKFVPIYTVSSPTSSLVASSSGIILNDTAQSFDNDSISASVQFLLWLQMEEQQRELCGYGLRRVQNFQLGVCNSNDSIFQYGMSDNEAPRSVLSGEIIPDSQLDYASRRVFHQNANQLNIIYIQKAFTQGVQLTNLKAVYEQAEEFWKNLCTKNYHVKIRYIFMNTTNPEVTDFEPLYQGSCSDQTHERVYEFQKSTNIFNLQYNFSQSDRYPVDPTAYIIKYYEVLRNEMLTFGANSQSYIMVYDEGGYGVLQQLQHPSILQRVIDFQTTSANIINFIHFQKDQYMNNTNEDLQDFEIILKGLVDTSNGSTLVSPTSFKELFDQIQQKQDDDLY